MKRDTFEQLETCIRLGRESDAASLAALFGFLASGEWRVRFAAAVALGDRRPPEAVTPLIELLKVEDAAPLFAQPHDMCGQPAGCNSRMEAKLPPDLPPGTAEAWRRRGRLKQAACFALGAIGPAAAPALPFLQRYATDQKEDYAVRAAACRALGLIGDPSSRATLEQATGDGEWCTSAEARKALAAVSGRGN